MNPNVLIISDDAEFARSVAARWRDESRLPGVTLVTSAVWESAGPAAGGLVIVGPVRRGSVPRIVAAVLAAPGTVAICLADKKAEAELPKHPNLIVMPQSDGWHETLSLVSAESLRRLEAAQRAQRAESAALASRQMAALGCYMLEMRPSVNDALTSILGNADLLLAGAAAHATREAREQIRTVHVMALRLNEIMQRFSSLAAEVQISEKKSQADTGEMACAAAVQP